VPWNHLRQERFALLQYLGVAVEAAIPEFFDSFRWQSAANRQAVPRRILHER